MPPAVSDTKPDESTQKALQSRLKAVRSSMEAADLDGLLINHHCDIEYLTGYTGHDAWLILTADGGAVISDSRYDEQMNPLREHGPVEVILGIRHRLHEAVASFVASHAVTRLGIQAEHLTVAARDVIARSTAGCALVDTTALVGSHRQLKDAGEISAIERAIRVNEEALRAALPELQLGMTEREFSAILEHEMKRRGGAGAGFTPIVAIGAHGSLPHYETADAPIVDGASLLIDWGTAAGGYQSDLTRTFAVNAFPEAIREIYPIVLEAQLAAIDAIAPGRVFADIDAVARKVITDAGYGEYFAHGLGHGMGKEVHEPPYFNNLETEKVLAPGHVMTVEPGIYLPGTGGVRIEDDIVVTETGCRVLSTFPKGIDDMVLSVCA